MDTEPVRTWPDVDEGFLTEVLRSLVQTRSVNPGCTEHAVAERIVRWLKQETTADIRMLESMPGRPSVAAVITGRLAGPALTLNGHTDTVPVENPELWSVDPFGAVVDGDLLFGRGACDMKGGLAVGIGVARLLARDRSFRGSLILHFASGEETAEPGTASLIDAGLAGDQAVVLEPTDLKVGTCARGLAFMRVRLTGRSAHGSRAAEGRNPISVLPAVLEAIEQHARDAETNTHPLLPAATANPTLVRSGVKNNMIPDTAEIVIDRRLLPDESAEQALADLRTRLESVVPTGFGCSVELDEHGFAAAESDGDSRLATVLRRTVEAWTGVRPDYWGTPYSSDFRELVHRARIPAVTFGPGRIENAHSIDEHISLPQLFATTRIVAATAMDLLEMT